MFVRLTHTATEKPCWVAVAHIQAVIADLTVSVPMGGSRLKMLDGWVDVQHEPDEVMALIEKAHK